MHYNLAPTDPRWLDADDETILRDMVILRKHNADMFEALNPTEALAEKAAQDPSIAAEMEQRKQDFLNDPGTQAALRSFGIGGKEDEPAPPMTLRLQGRTIVE